MGTLVETNLSQPSISKLAHYTKPAVRVDSNEARAKRNKEVFLKFAKNKDGALKMTCEEEIARQRGYEENCKSNLELLLISKTEWFGSLLKP